MLIPPQGSHPQGHCFVQFEDLGECQASFSISFQISDAFVAELNGKLWPHDPTRMITADVSRKDPQW
eukprot:9785708-Karenia_brevis.AAC.1